MRKRCRMDRSNGRPQGGDSVRPCGQTVIGQAATAFFYSPYMENDTTGALAETQLPVVWDD
jgi:hypothetical protein